MTDFMGLAQGLTLWAITFCTATICYRRARAARKDWT